MTTNALELTGIRKSFGADTVLKEIDLAVREGEFLSLVGMSGCGKSTLLRIIAGLEKPDQGCVSITGKDATELDPSERNLAMVFQSYALYPHMTVQQNIATPLRMRRLTLSARMPLFGRLAAPAQTLAEIDRHVLQAAETLQIDHLLDRKPAQLSGGQRQRVALARALVRSPAAFLMDEPLSNLDAKLRAHMRDELAALHKKLGTTFIYVTHDQVEAMTMSNRIALMNEGRIEQLGTPEQLYTRPANLTVAKFIGTPAINLLPVLVDLEGVVSLEGRDTGLRVINSKPGRATLGIRPEDLHIGSEGLGASIERVEMHGADCFLHCELHALPGKQLIVRHTSRELAKMADNGSIHLNFAREQAHLFDADGMRCDFAVAERIAA